MENNVYMPDILNCLANLSSDEVFTPPELANRMLDLLPPELFTNPETTFLDPCTKSGVFLREITKRLLAGLEAWEPDLQRRLDHILTRQVFGVALTELTADMSRRTLYCTKRADEPKYSVTQAFVQSHNPQGHVLFSRIGHTWDNGKCRFCGASETVFGDKTRQGLETHAYQFIHTLEPQELFNMTFDVIIGNPPYHISDGGARASAKPIYQLFVEKALNLKPNYMCMIIPARWYAGGKGLDNFRATMLHSNHLSHLIDYFDAADCFPSIDLSGGICYFLWEKNYTGLCEITTIRNKEVSTMLRPLLEVGEDSFIRFNEAISIIRKIKSKSEESFIKFISSRKPFGLSTTAKIKKTKSADSVFVYAYPDNGYINKKQITLNKSWIEDSKRNYKVYISYAYGERGSFPYLVIGKPFIGDPESCCTETYLVIGPFASKRICENVASYMRTKLFRMLVLLKKNTQHATSKVYSFVPLQDFTKPWTDAELYEKYGLDEKEIAFIESMIRPMED